MKHLSMVILFAGSVALAEQPAQPKKFESTKSEIEVSKATNAERKKKELPPLKLSLALSKIARAHSQNMARQGKLDHTLDEKTPFDRLKAAGYKYLKAGENIGGHQEGGNMQMIMTAWMESDGHRANILNPDYTEIGIGIAEDKDGNLYYTQVFAKPRK
ncbi:MAG: CAP domain-containing protein [Planctomycetes bacterium]|nr:CAP domain-containing protein [Planctomycetota bacterium]